MDGTVLTWLVFILAFGGMVIIHEFGHFIVARWSRIEVEEFGIGLPTPGAITFWISKGFLLLKNGRRIEIPRNFNLPIPWNSLVDRDAKLTVDQVDESFVLRSIEAIHIEEGQSSASSRKLIKAGNKRGEMEMADAIAEVHPGTRFTFNWLPLGGFVRPKGENDPNVEGGLAAASPWKRLAVLVAGPFMNLLTAVIVFSIIFNRVGVPDAQRVLVTDVVPNSPAAQAGFVGGDIFVTGNGQVIQDYDDLRVIVDANQNQPILFVVDRNGEQLELTATPLMNTESNRVMIGVGLSVPFKQPDSWVQTIQLGVSSTFYGARTLISLPAQMIRGTLAPEESRLIGLKGIFDIMEQSVSHDVEASSSTGTPAPSANPLDAPIRTLNLIAALSISLGIFNLFPFPALDGGRIIFVIPEILFRRRVPHQFENLVHGLGMAFLLLVMIYVNVMDFINPVTLPMP
jgi:regulator of sigma E protease